MLFLLDTDHASLLELGHPTISNRIADLNPNNVALSIVTIEEQLRGRLAQIRRGKSNHQLLTAYTALRNTTLFHHAFSIIDVTEKSLLLFEQLRNQKIRIGTLDLRIASIALTVNAVVVTRNRRDFEQVPNLKTADWTI